MQIPILNGIYADDGPDLRTSYPRNMVPVPKKQGVSDGYLRPAPGIEKLAEGPGKDRGGINYNGKCYRVMGSKLILVDSLGAITEIGDVGAGQGLQTTLDYSFDYLAVASAGSLYLYDPINSVFQRVVDPDLGQVIDVIWIDGYFMTTDGEFLVVSELGNPFSVLPTKYGSSEIDPDPVVALKEIRNEVYAVNRYTVEIFDNIGGDLFPFQRIDGAQLQRGCVGTKACTVYAEALAFIGSALKEEPAVWLGANGSTEKLSTREVDQVLKTYTEEELALSVLETRVEGNHNNLYIKLPDQTWVYDSSASAKLGAPVWYSLDSGLGPIKEYRAFNFVWCYNKWICGDPNTSNIGVLNDKISSHYGEAISWEFGSTFLYNEGNGAQVHQIELICLLGQIKLGVDATVFTSYTLDGVTYSQEKPRRVIKRGNRKKRLIWTKQGTMETIRAQKFRGTSDAHISVMRFEADIEGLAY